MSAVHRPLFSDRSMSIRLMARAKRGWCSWLAVTEDPVVAAVVDGSSHSGRVCQSSLIGRHRASTSSARISRSHSTLMEFSSTSFSRLETLKGSDRLSLHSGSSRQTSFISADTCLIVSIVDSTTSIVWKYTHTQRNHWSSSLFFVIEKADDFQECNIRLNFWKK